MEYKQNAGEWEGASGRRCAKLIMETSFGENPKPLVSQDLPRPSRERERRRRDAVGGGT